MTKIYLIKKTKFLEILWKTYVKYSRCDLQIMYFTMSSTTTSSPVLQSYINILNVHCVGYTVIDTNHKDYIATFVDIFHKSFNEPFLQF